MDRQEGLTDTTKLYKCIVPTLFKCWGSIIKNASQITQLSLYFYILITIQGTLSKFCRSVHSCLKLLYKNFRLRLLLCLHIMIIHTAVPPKMHLPAVFTHCPYLVMPARLGLINGQSSCAMSNVYQIWCLQN